MSKITPTFEEVSLVYYGKTLAKDRPPVHTAKQAYDILIAHWDKVAIQLIEESHLLLLDRSMRLMSIAHLSKGGMDKTIIDPKVIFATALKRRASQLILAHNHPSGSLNPSQADIYTTKKLVEGGFILDIPLLDHLIVTPDGYYSMADHGHLDRGNRPTPTLYM